MIRGLTDLVLACLWAGGRDFRWCRKCKAVQPVHKGKCLKCEESGR